jgi:uncharacterized protein (TIGR00730 family)
MDDASPGDMFPSAQQDADAATQSSDSPQTRAPSYRLAYTDQDFLMRDELRAVRLQLELLKPDLLQNEYGIDSTIVVFGSTRIPEPETAKQKQTEAELKASRNPQDPSCQSSLEVARRILDHSRYYDEARSLGRAVTTELQDIGFRKLTIVTGGGPGLMEAANRGASDAGGDSIGLNIVLPLEQQPNPYITPELCFQFHYFAIRKMHFLMRAKALIAFPGGFGTMDELFETLTLLQTGKIKPLPVILFGERYWRGIINFDGLVEQGTIDPNDLELITFVETAAEACAVIRAFYRSHVSKENA